MFIHVVLDDDISSSNWVVVLVNLKAVERTSSVEVLAAMVDVYKLEDVEGRALEEPGSVASINAVVVLDGAGETHSWGAGPCFTVPMTRRFEIENFELASMSWVPAAQSSFPGTQPELNHWDETITAPTRSMVSTTIALDSFDGTG